MISANPDVSGIGVRTAIYAQNLLSFVPAIWILKDGLITPTELDELEQQSTTILITAFAILISTAIQAHSHGISDYHASIVLDLSWMNNTNLFIYFLIYIYHRVNLTKDEFNDEVGISAARHAPPTKGFTRWIYVTKAALTHFVGFFLHHALPKDWTKCPVNRFKDGLDKECGDSASHDPQTNQIKGLTRWIYETKKASKNYVIIIGSLHLTLMAAVDTEVAIKNNTNRFQLAGEAQWTFGQTLAVLLLLVSLRDLIESILERRAKKLDKRLLKACRNGKTSSVQSLLQQGARRSIL
ncbi:hypothetical protein C0992_002798, partial [Termitomyces sp. T32_za158]